MTKKLRQIASWSLLILIIVVVVMALRTPTLSLVPASAEAAKSFDEKIAAIELARLQGNAKPAHITELELTSKLQESIEAAPAAQGPVKLTSASVHLEDDAFVAVLSVSVSGKDLYVTFSGTLGVLDGSLQIRPSAVSMGSLPIPLWAAAGALQRQLDSPAAREQMRLPDIIKDVRIENGELIVEGK